MGSIPLASEITLNFLPGWLTKPLAGPMDLPPVSPRTLEPANSHSSSDQDLIDAVNLGDTEAFEALYLRHRDWVVNLAFRWTGDHSLALDVLQETFLYFLKRFPGFTLTCQLRSFLYPAVRNLSIVTLHKARRGQSESGELPELEAPPPSATGDAARDQVAAVVSALPGTHREVLLLRFVDGLSLAEIAEALEIPLGTVKSRLHYALDVLRRDERTRKFHEG
jgi:RNA polymerase sigma-70 factor (ECF subfamily)